MTLGLTKQQSALYDVLLANSQNGRVSLSYQEMAVAIGLSANSKSSIHFQIICLEERGYIRRLVGRRRSVAIIGEHDSCPHCHHPLGSKACRDAADRSRITYSKTPAQPGARQ